MLASSTWDRKTRLKAKRLYCIEGMSPKEISKRTRVPVQTVSNWAWRYGWTRKRQEAETKALAQVEDQARAEIVAALDSVAARSEELVERGLDLAESAADEGDAKGFAMAAKGVQSLHAVWRQAKGIDAKGAAGTGAPQLTVIYNQFGDAGAAAQPVEIKASPVSAEVILDFDQSQQGDDGNAVSADLMQNGAQLVDAAD